MKKCKLKKNDEKKKLENKPSESQNFSERLIPQSGLQIEISSFIKEFPEKKGNFSEVCDPNLDLINK